MPQNKKKKSVDQLKQEIVACVSGYGIKNIEKYSNSDIEKIARNNDIEVEYQTEKQKKKEKDFRKIFVITPQLAHEEENEGGMRMIDSGKPILIPYNKPIKLSVRIARQIKKMRKPKKDRTKKTIYEIKRFKVQEVKGDV